MIRAMFWKEWREHWVKYAIYWLLLNFPILFVAVILGSGMAAKNPLTDLSNATAMKYLQLSLGESWALMVLFPIFTGGLAVATFSPEIENGSLFFIYEQAVSRGRYAAMKLLNGGFHIVLAVCFAMLAAPAAVYAMLLASGKVTAAAAGAEFASVIAAAGRSVVWCSLISLMAFTFSAGLSVLLRRWWLAGACAAAAIIAFINDKTTDFFTLDSWAGGGTSSASVQFNQGKPWLLVTGTPMHAADWARFHPLPLLTAALAVAVFATATALAYRRREVMQ